MTRSAQSIHVRLLPRDELGITRPFDELRDMAEMDVHVVHFAGIDTLAGLGIGLIGKSKLDASCHGESAIEFGTG